MISELRSLSVRQGCMRSELGDLTLSTGRVMARTSQIESRCCGAGTSSKDSPARRKRSAGASGHRKCSAHSDRGASPRRMAVALCLIGAGAVVTTSVPDFALFLGVPACHHGWVSKSGCVLDSNLICPHDGSTYLNVDGVLKPL